MKAIAWLFPAAIFAVSLTASPLRAATPVPPAAPAEADGTIDGTTIPRGNGEFIGLQVVGGTGGTFKLSTYNKKKKPENCPFTQAVLRWPVHYQPNDERTLLLPSSDPTALTSEKPVRAPLAFKLYISLFVAGKEDPVESYVIDFQG